MVDRNPNDAALRKVVTERLRRFFADLTAQLEAGTAEIWSRVERRLARKSREIESEGEVPPSPGFPTPMQQQPVQQQQTKSEPKD